MSGRRKAPSKRVPGGYPQVTHPRDRAAYGWQIGFVHGWFEEMLARLGGEDALAARAAREALGAAFLGFTSTLLGLAKVGKDKKAREWAGRLLASVHGSIQKQDEKLSRVNKAYRLEKKKFGKLRVDVLFPKGFRKVVQRELRKAERLRRRLLVIEKHCGEEWRGVAKRQGIAESYWPVIKLPEFSVESEPVWWKFLGPLFRKKIDMSKMRPLKQRDQEHGGIKDRKRYLSDLQKGCRDHLRSVARQRDAGLL